MAEAPKTMTKFAGPIPKVTSDDLKTIIEGVEGFRKPEMSSSAHRFLDFLKKNITHPESVFTIRMHHIVDQIVSEHSNELIAFRKYTPPLQDPEGKALAAANLIDREVGEQ